MKKNTLLLIIGIMVFSQPVIAQESVFDSDVIVTSNRALWKMYDVVYEQKRSYPELKDFNTKSMIKAETGVYSLYYRFDEYLSIKKGELYHFGVAINEVGSKNEFKYIGKTFKYEFPFLGVQVVGGKVEDVNDNGQFDIQPVVEEMVIDLWRLEQSRLPYQIKVRPSKKTYRTGDKIQLMAEVENKTKNNLKLKNLGPNIMAIRINENLYGPPRFNAKNIKKAKTIILKSGQKRKRKITLSGFEEPGEYEISCTYLVPHQQVFPQDVVKINVVD